MYLSRRLNLIASCFYSLTAVGQTSTKSKLDYNPARTYAGIEVGSKGVKLSIIEMGKNAATTGRFKALKDTSINSDFITFTSSSFSATLDALTALYQYAGATYNLKSDRIFTTVSSGVKGQVEKENKSELLIALIDSFKIRLGEPQRKVDVIDVATESRLSHVGIIPESRRHTTFLIDIGSGNTKGGYFQAGSDTKMKLFNLNWGTKSVANATEKRLADDNSVTNFKKQLMRVMAGDPNDQITYAVNESGAYSMNDNFAFSGGIAWASAMFMYPELYDQSVVPLDFFELVSFNERLYTAYDDFTSEKLTSFVAGTAEEKAEAKAEFERVHKVFDRKALMAGAALLQQIVRQFEGVFEKKQFFLVKNGQVGWISAYVTEQINAGK